MRYLRYILSPLSLYYHLMLLTIIITHFHPTLPSDSRYSLILNSSDIRKIIIQYSVLPLNFHSIQISSLPLRIHSLHAMVLRYFIILYSLLPLRYPYSHPLNSPLIILLTLYSHLSPLSLIRLLHHYLLDDELMFTLITIFTTYITHYLSYPLIR